MRRGRRRDRKSTLSRDRGVRRREWTQGGYCWERFRGNICGGLLGRAFGQTESVSRWGLLVWGGRRGERSLLHRIGRGSIPLGSTSSGKSSLHVVQVLHHQCDLDNRPRGLSVLRDGSFVLEAKLEFRFPQLLCRWCQCHWLLRGRWCADPYFKVGAQLGSVNSVEFFERRWVL